MQRVVIRPIEGQPSATRPPGVTERPVRENGELTVVHVLDGRRPSFGDDLTYVFAQNVARARQENERLTGSPDGVPARR